MSDLDADLLALADGDDSGEEGNVPAAVKSESETYSPPPATGGRASAGRSATPKKSKARPRRTKRADSDEDVNSDDNELDSAPMSESDVDVGSPGSDDSGPMYPLEGKYKDHADKAYVEGLPEVEREAIIAERKELDERKRQDNYLKRLHQKYKAENEGKVTPKKRKAADGEEGDRRSARKRTMVGGRKVGETSSTLEAYKARREQKNLLAEQRKAGVTDRKARAHSVSEPSDADAEGESDVEWGDVRAGSARREEQVYEEPAELRDFQLVMVGRQHFAQVCFYPGFEETVRNCYIRVNIGGNPATGESLYRMAKITGTREREDKPYAIEGPNGKPFVTKQFVKCSMGKTEREFPFIFCSMTRFNEREFASYKATVTNDGLSLPSKKDLRAKLDDINHLVNRSFTEKELQEKLERSGVLKARADANKRADLIKQRERATTEGDSDKADSLTEQIKALEPPKLAFGTSLQTEADRERANRGPTEQQRLGELNRRNRKENAERVRRAQIAEKKARMELARKVERGEATGDPFARVKVLPKIHYDASEPFAQRRAGTPLSNAGGSSRGGTPTPGASQRDKSPLPKEKEKSPLPASTHLTVPKPGGVDFAQFDPMARLAATSNGVKDGEKGESGNEGEKKPSVFKRKLYDEEILAGMDFGAELDIEVL